MRVRVIRPEPGRWVVRIEGDPAHAGPETLEVVVDRANIVVEFSDLVVAAAAEPADGGPLFGERAPVPVAAAADEPQAGARPR